MYLTAGDIAVFQIAAGYLVFRIPHAHEVRFFWLREVAGYLLLWAGVINLAIGIIGGITKIAGMFDG